MSRHSHWATIKYKKGIADIKKGKLFSKIVKMVEIAARKDPNPQTNPTLKMAIEKAKAANMPLEKIDSAIKKASGKSQGQILEEVILEGLGPHGALFIIEGITDNRNRFIALIRQILKEYGGSLAQKGSVFWNFWRRGLLRFKGVLDESSMLELIEHGVQDFKTQNGLTEIIVKPESFDDVINLLNKKGLEVLGEIVFSPKTTIDLDNQEIIVNLKNLIDELTSQDEVKSIFHNIKNVS